MNSLDKQYLDLLQDIMDTGANKDDRTGTGTRSVFGRTIRHDIKEGFPLLTTKKMHWKGIVGELLWFLRGRTDIRWLLDRGNKIWVGDAYRNYIDKCGGNDSKLDSWMKENEDGSLSLYTKEEFVKWIVQDDEFGEMWGDLNKIYGHQWRKWSKNNHYNDGDNIYSAFGIYDVDHTEELPEGELYIDQIKNVIQTLETNPDSRRMIVSAWNVSDLDDMVLMPCHYSFQFYTNKMTLRERILNAPKHLKDQLIFNISGDDKLEEQANDLGFPSRTLSILWTQRSVDTALGLPYNIASYGLLLQLVAKQVNMIPNQLIGNLGDTHIYKDQFDGVNEQLSREVKFKLPKVEITGDYDLKYPEKTPLMSQIKLLDYESDEKIYFPLSN